MDTLSFKKWCALLTVSVLRTRTPFAKFLLSTLHLPRGSLVSASPAFPLPIPFPGVFARMLPALSSAKRCRINFRRALHVVIMALNEVLSLARLWDARGLLYIHEVDIQLERRFELVTVFNCLKNATTARQTGDRRIDVVEMQLRCVSRDLPKSPYGSGLGGCGR